MAVSDRGSLNIYGLGGRQDTEIAITLANRLIFAVFKPPVIDMQLYS